MNQVDAALKLLMYRLRSSIKAKHVAAVLRYTTRRKLANLLRVELGRRRGLTAGFGYPYVLTVEPTNVCNLRCPLCPTGKGLLGRRRQSLAVDTFDHLLEEIGPYVYVINFQNWGEPTLARSLPTLVAHAHEHRIFTCLATNGNYSPRLNDALIDAGLDHVTFALDGASQEVYRQYRVGGDFERITANIRDLAAAKRRRGARRPFIEVQLLVFDHTRGEVDRVRSLAETLGADGLMVRAGEAADNAANLATYYTWDSPRGYCSRFWYTATIASDGGISPCCNYFDRRDDFGDVVTRPFHAVWNGARYRESRRAVVDRRPESLGPICRSCKVYDQARVSYPIWNLDDRVRDEVSG